MKTLSELEQDGALRRRLIATCLGVAIVVSVVFLVVSYRLTSDVTVKAEEELLREELALIQFQITNAGARPQEHLEEVYQSIKQSAEDIEFAIELAGPGVSWSRTYKLSENDKRQLKTRVSESDLGRAEKLHSGTFDIETKKFVWARHSQSGFEVFLARRSNAFTVAQPFIVKRLLITSLIVFWIAVWLALVLSSWIDKRVRAKNDALKHLATHDSLTGLPNRLFLNNLFAQYEHDLIRGANHIVSGAMYLLDLDKFKEVNDTFGHAEGDRLLAELASRLSNFVPQDHILVRMGGDEFIIWVPDWPEEKIAEYAKRLVAVCEIPVVVNQVEINTGASIGVAKYPEHADTLSDLLVCSDRAMYDAKRMRTGWAMHESQVGDNTRLRLRLRAQLNGAFENREIKLYFQTKVDLATGRIVGLEALSRWQHPTDGLLSPDMFIELIETSGRVQDFGRYTIQEAVKHLKSWYSLGFKVPVAVNLSPYNMLDAGLQKFTAGLLDEYGLPRDALEIELTESETSISVHLIAGALQKFREIGVPLSLDDFGTGMSSLSHIEKLNVNFIKIDRSFVSDLDINEKHRALVGAVIALSKSFDASVVAEGIENAEQARLLLEMGCNCGQGYYYSKPEPVELILQKLSQHCPS